MKMGNDVKIVAQKRRYANEMEINMFESKWFLGCVYFLCVPFCLCPVTWTNSSPLGTPLQAAHSKSAALFLLVRFLL